MHPSSNLRGASLHRKIHDVHLSAKLSCATINARTSLGRSVNVAANLCAAHSEKNIASQNSVLFESVALSANACNGQLKVPVTSSAHTSRMHLSFSLPTASCDFMRGLPCCMRHGPNASLQLGAAVQ